MQKRGCTVSHLYSCSGDPQGLQWRADFAEDGMTYYGAIDAETQWIESHHLLAGRVERLLPGAADPASLTTLMSTGRDDFDFVTQDDAGYRTRFVGYDRLTGERVTVDGVTLDRTAFDVIATDVDTGAVVWRVTGNEFIQRDWRTFIAGTSRYELPDDVIENDYSPMEFLFPGDEGFLSVHPKYDCGLMISLIPDPLTSQGRL
ncbi:hypothetical protein GCM10011392_07870 [Wenxinia marina]|nr:hypothetical protein GCM10011392_07870 [Wenxinia marina]